MGSDPLGRIPNLRPQPLPRLGPFLWRTCASSWAGGPRRQGPPSADARRAKDTTVAANVTGLRLDAEKRLGEMIAEQKRTVGLNTGAMGIGKSAVPQENRTPTLASAGIDKKLSARSQKLAALSSEGLAG